jgi:hypothetical protein
MWPCTALPSFLRFGLALSLLNHLAYGTMLGFTALPSSLKFGLVFLLSSGPYFLYGATWRFTVFPSSSRFGFAFYLLDHIPHTGPLGALRFCQVLKGLIWFFLFWTTFRIRGHMVLYGFAKFFKVWFGLFSSGPRDLRDNVVFYGVVKFFKVWFVFFSFSGPHDLRDMWCFMALSSSSRFGFFFSLFLDHMTYGSMGYFTALPSSSRVSLVFFFSGPRGLRNTVGLIGFAKVFKVRSGFTGQCVAGSNLFGPDPVYLKSYRYLNDFLLLILLW